MALLASGLPSTFLPIAANSKSPFSNYSFSVIDRPEKVEGAALQITEIMIKLRLILAQEKDRERATRIVAKAGEHCIISCSIRQRLK